MISRCYFHACQISFVLSHGYSHLSMLGIYFFKFLDNWPCVLPERLRINEMSWVPDPQQWTHPGFVAIVCCYRANEIVCGSCLGIILNFRKLSPVPVIIFIPSRLFSSIYFLMAVFLQDNKLVHKSNSKKLQLYAIPSVCAHARARVCVCLANFKLKKQSSSLHLLCSVQVEVVQQLIISL